MRSNWLNRCRRILGVVACLSVFAGCAGRAQEPVAASAIGVQLQVLAGRAADIFVGQITAVERTGNVVAVQFRVEQPLRGAAGATFTMQEWAGQWPVGHTRYLVGQRVLAFVQGASGAGFRSPVHGAEGLVPVIVQGANVPQMLDVRRVAAAVVRAPGTPLPTETNGAVQLNEALGWIGLGAGNAAAPRGLLPVPTRGRRPVMQQGTGGAEAEPEPVAAEPEPVRELQSISAEAKTTMTVHSAVEVSHVR